MRKWIFTIFNLLCIVLFAIALAVSINTHITANPRNLGMLGIVQFSSQIIILIINMLLMKKSKAVALVLGTVNILISAVPFMIFKEVIMRFVDVYIPVLLAVLHFVGLVAVKNEEKNYD